MAASAAAPIGTGVLALDWNVSRTGEAGGGGAHRLASAVSYMDATPEGKGTWPTAGPLALTVGFGLGNPRLLSFEYAIEPNTFLLADRSGGAASRRREEPPFPTLLQPLSLPSD